MNNEELASGRTITMKVTLVPHGYEISIEGSGRVNLYGESKTLTECRDFGRSIDTQKGIDKIIDVVRSLDK